MPQIEIIVGGRGFEVACQPGEEPFLKAAAATLDAEASSLSSQIGRMPEARMLLMAGLMLADKTATVEERLRVAEARIGELETRLASQVPVEVPVEIPVEVRVEVAVVPPEIVEMFEDVAEEAEALERAVAALAPRPADPATA